MSDSRLNKFEEKIDIRKIFVSLIFSIYFFYYALNPSDWHFIDNVNLIIHEAGHSIFSFFGEFINILGGSLLQVLLPAIFCYYFFCRLEYFSSSLVLFWVGQNLINVSVYASDAIQMNLPLLGGDNSIHDWNYLLGELGILNYTPYVGKMLFFGGILILSLAAIGAFYYSTKKKTALEF